MMLAKAPPACANASPGKSTLQFLFNLGKSASDADMPHEKQIGTADNKLSETRVNVAARMTFELF